MKILFILGKFPLLSETFILNQITGLIDRGHEVHIYATKKITGGVHADVYKYDLFDRTFFCMELPGGRFRRYVGAFHLAWILGKSKPAMLLRAIYAARYSRRLSSMMIFYDLKSMADFASYDIIHCHFGYHGIRGMLLRETGVLRGKLVTTFHGFDITSGLKKTGPKFYSFLFEKGDLFLPISERWKQRLIELGCDEKKIQVHRMGIDCRRFAFKPRMPEPGGRFKIVTVARLMEKKGLEFGIKAVARLKKDFDNIEYTIIGDGPLKESLKLLAKDLGIQNSVQMIGSQPQHRVVEFLEKSHLFMLPSVTAANGDQEGIPVVLMEAMAMGLPVVSTLHSGIPELVEDGVSGFLVSEKDVTALFKKLKYLAENPSRYAEMGHHGRQMVEKNYNISLLNDKLVDIFNRLMRLKN
jgi:colanic acid/amylovoran biosynthesis glycosyltransferase